MAKWGDGRESGPGPKGNASGCRGFRIEGIGAGKISAHNHMEWLRNCEKGPFPAGDATAGNAGESGAREESCGGEAGVLYCVFPRNPVVCPPTFGGRSVLRSARRLCPASVWDTGTGGARSGCAPPTGGEGNIISHNLFNYVNFIPRKEAANSFLPMPCICAIRCNRVTRQTVLCTTPFSFGMKKLGKSILWHTVCINKKAGACSRLFVYAVFIRSAAILAYSGESSMPTHLLPVAFAARAVEPPPRKGSSTVPPSGTTPMSSAMS